MPTDLFDFWAECPPEATEHPQDKAVFARVGNMGFDLRCLPCNFWGPLRTAPVVLLYLSPGLDESDLPYAASDEGKAAYAERRKGFRPLDTKEQHASGWRWWTSRTRAIGPMETVRHKLAILNIGAYHSRKFDDAHALMALPSSRAAIDYAQAVLFPAAEREERVVICLRKPRAWGLKVGEKYLGNLFAPPTNAAGHMVNGDQREAVVKAARQALGLS